MLVPNVALSQTAVGEAALLTQKTAWEQVEKPLMSGKYGNCPKQDSDLSQASNTGKARKEIRFHSSYGIMPLQEWNLLKIQKHGKNSKMLQKTSFFA